MTETMPIKDKLAEMRRLNKLLTREAAKVEYGLELCMFLSKLTDDPTFDKRTVASIGLLVVNHVDEFTANAHALSEEFDKLKDA